jgi:hypothetical protein
MAGSPRGVGTWTMNSEPWNVIKSSCRASRPKREMLASQTEIGDYSEVPQTGKMTITVRPRPFQDSTQLANVVNGTGVLEERDGVTWYGADLVQTGEADYDTAEGTMELMFEGTVTRETAA